MNQELEVAVALTAGMGGGVANALRAEAAEEAWAENFRRTVQPRIDAANAEFEPFRAEFDKAWMAGYEGENEYMRGLPMLHWSETAEMERRETEKERITARHLATLPAQVLEARERYDSALKEIWRI